MNRQESFGWRLKNSIFFIFALVPMLQWIPCFMMNGKLPKKKWLAMGFANLMVLGMIAGASIVGESWYQQNHGSLSHRPGVSEYVDTSTGFTTYSQTPEYAAYEAAMEEYEASDEYLQYRYAGNMRRSLQTGCRMMFVANYLIFMILILFVERYRYLRELADLEARRSVYEGIGGVAPPDPERREIKKRKPEPVSGRRTLDMTATQTETEDAVTEEGKLNVNTATEAELMSLPGMLTINAKKVVDWRQKNGSFKTTDEFFEAMGAKPHMIVRMQDKITIAAEAITRPAATAGKPRFDL